MIMLIYILKSSACLAIFLMFYKLFLEKENMHIFKRFYLLGATMAALFIPLVIFTEYVEVTAISQNTISPIYDFSPEIVVPQKTFKDYLPGLLWTLYLVGVLLFGVQFLKNLFRIFQRIRKNPRFKNNNIFRVLLSIPTIPHTFFNYIFISQQKFEAQEIPEVVLLHEEIHAKQKHSADVLCVELLQVLFWFNPLLYVLKKAIKLNHEFLADQAVVQTGVTASTYQSLILAYSSNALSPQLANSINYSSIKKRISVMKTHTSKKSILLRSVLLLPLVAVLLFGFSETKVVEVEKRQSSPAIIKSKIQKEATPEQVEEYNALAKKYNAVPIHRRVIKKNELSRLELIFNLMSPSQKESAHPFPECPPPPGQEPATKKQVAEYNTLAKEYNTMIKKGNVRIKKSEVDQMENIYNLMTDAQKEKAEPYPDFPSPPPVPTPPSAPKNVSDTKYASNQIKHIIENQDPNDGILININASPMVTKGDKSLMQPPLPHTHINDREPNIPTSPPSPKDVLEIKVGTPVTPLPPHGKTRMAMASGKILIDEEEYYYITEDGFTKYYTSHGIEVDKKGKLITPPTEPIEFIEIVEVDEMESPDSPKPPMSPIDHIVQMAKQGALFYYEGKEISSDKAIEILKKNKNININSNAKGERPVVKLSTKPIVIEN